jgi:hypothetical protein
VFVASVFGCSAGASDDPGPGANSGGNTGTILPGAGGGVADGGGGPIIVADGGGIDDMECGRESFELVRKPAKILLVLDRSGSMKDPPDGSTDSSTKWDLVVPAVNQAITETDADVAWGLKVFPEGEGESCVAGSVTNNIDVPLAPLNAATVVAAVNVTTPEGNGTPTGDAVTAAAGYLQSLTAAGDTDQKYILLATDGEPSCAGTSEGQEGARPYAVAAVTAAATAGFHTFVVGVSTTKTNATQALNDMAVAGLEPRPQNNPLATKYYLANTKDELVSAMKAITGVVASCRFDLASAPPVPDHVGVLISGEKVPAEGWSYTSASNTSLEVTGVWCDQIKAAAAGDVQIIFGCPNDPVY